MSLRNLVGVSLEVVAPSQGSIRRLLAAADRHIADSRIKAVSPDTRFGAAYTAIRMLADVGLFAHGYRTLTSKPGHHQTAIQTLPLTFGLDARTVMRLDALRQQRHRTEYTGDAIPESALAECVAQAEALRAAATAWLKLNKPELM